MTESGEEEASLDSDKGSEAKEGSKSAQKLGSESFPGETRKRIATNGGPGEQRMRQRQGKEAENFSGHHQAPVPAFVQDYRRNARKTHKDQE